MRNMLKILALSLAVLMLCSCAAADTSPPAAKPGRSNGTEHKQAVFDETQKAEMLKSVNNVDMMDFKLPLMGGGEIAREDILGKVVVLNAMASWCGYCIQELPYLAEASAMYSSDDVLFLGVQTFENDWAKGETALKKDLESAGAAFSIAQDKTDELGMFMSPRGSIPVTMVLDGKGIVRFVYPGALSGTKDLTDMIDFVLQYQHEF